MAAIGDFKATMDRAKLLIASKIGVWSLAASASNLKIKASPPKPAKERDNWREVGDLVSSLDQMFQELEQGLTAPPPPPQTTTIFYVGRSLPVPPGTDLPDGYEWFRDRVCRKDRAEFVRLLEEAHRRGPIGLVDQDYLASEMKSYLKTLELVVSDPVTKGRINKFRNSPDQHLLDNLVQDMRLPCQNTCSMAGHHLYDCKDPTACNHHGCKSTPGGEIGYLIRVPMMVAAEFKLMGIEMPISRERFYKIVM